MGKFTKDIKELGGYKFIDSKHNKEIVTLFNDDNELEIMVFSLNFDDNQTVSAISSVKINMQSGKMISESF